MGCYINIDFVGDIFLKMVEKTKKTQQIWKFQYLDQIFTTQSIKGQNAY
jgi:hypothetical protein